MKRSGVREIKNRFSAYLRMVEQGERVAVTRRGRVVAELVPPAHTAEDAARGELRRRAPNGNRAPGRPEPPRRLPAPCGLPSRVVQELLDGVRGER